MKLLELKEKLGISEPKLKTVIYHMTPSVFVNEDFVEIDKRYDFVINGDRLTMNNIAARARKHNESLQEGPWEGVFLARY